MLYSCSGLVSESSAYFEFKQTTSGGGCSYWYIPVMSTFGHHFVLQIAAWKRHLSFSWSFFVTSDVCTTGGLVGAVITTPGAIHDGSGGQHSALFTPAQSSAFCLCSTATDNCQKDTTLKALILLLRLYCARFITTFSQT